MAFLYNYLYNGVLIQFGFGTTLHSTARSEHYELTASNYSYNVIKHIIVHDLRATIIAALNTFNS